MLIRMLPICKPFLVKKDYSNGTTRYGLKLAHMTCLKDQANGKARYLQELDNEVLELKMDELVVIYVYTLPAH